MHDLFQTGVKGRPSQNSGFGLNNSCTDHWQDRNARTKFCGFLNLDSWSHTVILYKGVNTHDLFAYSTFWYSRWGLPSYTNSWGETFPGTCLSNRVSNMSPSNNLGIGLTTSCSVASNNKDALVASSKMCAVVDEEAVWRLSQSMCF